MAHKHVKESLKKTNLKNTKQMRVTVRFGYGLFALVAISFFLSITPWFRVFHEPWPHPMNIAIILLTLVTSTLAPPLAGYIVGGGVTYKKSSLLHHYNGILLGIVGFWLGLIFSTILTYLQWLPFFAYTSIATYRVTQFIPVVLAIAGVLLLGLLYARRTRHQVPLIDYLPYRRVLAGVIVVFLLLIGISPFFGVEYGGNIGMSVFILLITPVTLFLAAGLTGYWVLGKKGDSVADRVAKSMVAGSFGFLLFVAFSQLAGYLPAGQLLFASLALVVSGGMWVLYLYALRRAGH